MATSITINLNDEDESILIKITAEINSAPDNPGLSPSQVLREHTRDWIRSHRSRFDEQEQLRLRSAYRQATPEEQATIDTILDKYR